MEKRSAPLRAWRRYLACCAAVAAVAVLSACGSSDSSSGSTSATGGASSSGSSTASRQTIKTMTIAPVNAQGPTFPNTRWAANAAANYINAHGGVGGRKVDPLFCDSQGTPQGLAACAQRAVSEKVVAVVGGMLLSTSALIPILDKAHVAWLGSPGVDNAEYNTDNVFEMGGQLAYQAGQGLAAAQQGCKSVIALVPDVAGVGLAEEMLKNGYKAGGGNAANYSSGKFPITTTDFTSFAAKTTSVDCTIPFVATQLMGSFLAAMNTVGSNSRLIGYTGLLPQDVAKKYPKYADGYLESGAFADWQTSPDWADYRDSLKAVKAPQGDYSGPNGGQLTWAAFMAFQDIGKNVSDPNAQSFLAAAGKASNVDTKNTTGPLDFTQKFAGLGGRFPRFFNRHAVQFKWKDARPVEISHGFVDMTGAVQGQPAK